MQPNSEARDALLKLHDMCKDAERALLVSMSTKGATSSDPNAYYAYQGQRVAYIRVMEWISGLMPPEITEEEIEETTADGNKKNMLARTNPASARRLLVSRPRPERST